MIRRSRSSWVTRDGFCWVATTNSLLLYKDPIAAADELKRSNRRHRTSFPWRKTAKVRFGSELAMEKSGNCTKNNWLELANFSQTNAITAIVTEADGSMWVGTAGKGLYRFINGSFHHVEKSEGLLSDMIRALYPDPQGTLWIGTAGDGLSRVAKRAHCQFYRARRIAR